MNHLKCFCADHDTVIKDNLFFKCLPEDPLQFTITDKNKVSFFSNYSLVATINHSGNLNNGHDWAIIKEFITNQWFACNDKVVFKIIFLRKKISFSFFFSVLFMQGAFVNSDMPFSRFYPLQSLVSGEGL